MFGDVKAGFVEGVNEAEQVLLEHHHAVPLVPFLALAAARLAYLEILGPVRGPLNINEVRPTPGLDLDRELLLAVAGRRRVIIASIHRRTRPVAWEAR